MSKKMVRARTYSYLYAMHHLRGLEEPVETVAELADAEGLARLRAVVGSIASTTMQVEHLLSRTEPSYPEGEYQAALKNPLAHPMPSYPNPELAYYDARLENLYDKVREVARVAETLLRDLEKLAGQQPA